MDFLEAFVVKNDRISDEIKMELLSKRGMLSYDFMGELMSLENIDHLGQIHEKLSDADFERIKSSQKAMKKIIDLKQFVEQMEDSEEREEIQELLQEFDSNS